MEVKKYFCEATGYSLEASAGVVNIYNASHDFVGSIYSAKAGSLIASACASHRAERLLAVSIPAEDTAGSTDILIDIAPADSLSFIEALVDSMTMKQSINDNIDRVIMHLYGTKI